MPQLIKQTVYLPIKVEDELPENNKNVFCLISDGFETELVFEDGVFRLYEGGDCYEYEKENVSHWLKPQELFVFTPEQLNEYTDKLFTVEDMRKALWCLGDVLFNNNQNGIEEGEPEKYFNEIIQSLLPKTEWDVEINEQGKIKLI